MGDGYAGDTGGCRRRAAAVVAAALVAAALLACKLPLGDGDVAPVVTASAAPAPAPERDAGPSAEARSEDGRVTVARPSGGLWSCEDRVVRSPQLVTLVKCRLESGGFLFMVAKDYVVTGSPADAKGLLTRVYRKNYERLFQAVKYGKQGPITHQGKAGYEVEFDARHATKGVIHKRERVVVAGGGHYIVVSAEGTPMVMKRHAAQVTAWFASARFEALL